MMGKTIFGLIFIALGTLFLLTNAGVIEMDLNTIISIYWPVLIIFWGVCIFIIGLARLLTGGNPMARAGNHLFWGLVLLGIGSVIQGNKLDYFDIGWSNIWSWAWPLLIIYIGLKILFKRNTHRFSVSVDTNNEKSKDNYVKNIHSSKRKQLVGDINIGSTPWQLEDLYLWFGVGDSDLDLTKAILPEGETVVDISGWVGDVTVLVPQDMDINASIDVRIGEATLFGHNQSGSARFLSYKSEHYESARKKVLLRVSLSIGDVTVKRVN
jgi:lia operon protein LiaF